MVESILNHPRCPIVQLPDVRTYPLIAATPKATGGL